MEENLAAETPYLRAFLRKLVLSTAGLEIDDLLQETMNRAIKYSHTYDAKQALRPWLQRIGFRTFLDAREKAKRQPSVPFTCSSAVCVKSRNNCTWLRAR